MQTRVKEKDMGQGQGKEEARYGYEDFLEIIARLRAEDGCPWDREQTHESLRPCMMEEAAEVLAAIGIYEETGSDENLIEELGDVLLQVVMHAQIAAEQGRFTMEDVVQAVAAKMVRRHPHVFGTRQADSSEQVLANWEEIKKEEKREKAWMKGPLGEIPLELPALTRILKVQKKVDKLYEPQPGYEKALERMNTLVERLERTRPDTYSAEVADILGEMQLQMSQIARICKLSQEQILWDKTQALISKYEGR